MFGGFWFRTFLDRWAATAGRYEGAQRGKGRAVPECCSSICSTCCQSMVEIPEAVVHERDLSIKCGGSVQNLSHFRLAERYPALAHAVMAPLICWSFSNSMFRYRLVDHAVPAMWRSLAAARLSAD